MQQLPDDQTLRIASWLGYAGALPFVCFAVLAHQPVFISAQTAIFALLSYGAVILSFLGGLHWGRIMVSQSLSAVFSGGSALIYSVLLSLGGWTALLMPEHTAALFLAACFAGALFVDLRLVTTGVWPAFLYRLRLHLSLAAVVCLVSLLAAPAPH